MFSLEFYLYVVIHQAWVTICILFNLQTTRGFGDRWFLHREKEATAAGTMTEEANLRRNLTTEVATVTQQLHQEDHPLLFILCNKQQPSWWCLAKRNTSRTTRQQMAPLLLALPTDFDTVSSPRTGVRHTTSKHKLSLATRQTSSVEETPNHLLLVLGRGRAPRSVPKATLRYKLMNNSKK